MQRLAGDPITRSRRKHRRRPPLGGLKVSTDDGWFAARPSGTEDVYKIYAESFISEGEHLKKIQNDAQQAIARLI